MGYSGMSDQEAAAGGTEELASTETGSSSGETVEQVIERMLPADPDDEGSSKPARGKAKAETLADPDDAAPEEDENDDDDLDDDEEGEEASAESDEDEPEEDDEEPEDEEAALEHAYEVLLKSKRAPFSVLKSTPKAKLIAWAKQVEEEQASASERASKPAERERTDPQASKDEGRSARSESPDKSWQDWRASAARQLGVDEESVDAFKPLYDRAAKAEELSAEFEALRAEIRERDGRATISRELQRLEASYPTLKAGGKKADKVVDEAMTIVAGLKSRGKPVNVEAAFTRAAEAVLGKPKRSDLASLRRNGFATAPTGTREGLDTTKSETEYWDKAVSHAMAGRGDLIRRLRPPQREPAKNGRSGSSRLGTGY